MKKSKDGKRLKIEKRENKISTRVVGEKRRRGRKKK